MYTNYVPFRPALEGIFLERFTQVIIDLVNPFSDQSYVERVNQIEKTSAREVQWAVNGIVVNPQQRRIYRTVWLLLNDLVRAGWQCRWRAGTLEIASPYVPESVKGDEAVKEIKEQIRQAMRPARLAKIAESRAFILRMERPDHNSEVTVPITVLIANGVELADKLERIGTLDKASQLETLCQTIKPYLQLVEVDKVCDLTGYRLHDIWRYFRFFWSSPPEPTPGRTMQYLVRDAANPYHPIIGIASLENGALQSPNRDTFLGWTVEAFEQQVTHAGDAEARQHIERVLRYVNQTIDEIDIDDICTSEQIAHPDVNLLRHLRYVAEQAEQQRQAAVASWRREQAEEKSELGNLSRQAVDAMYRRKRADGLRKLLYAKMKIEVWLRQPDFSWETCLAMEEGQTVVRIALQAQKSRFVGTNVLEVNVCGAIPPYTHLLGGKLVALLMLSPQIVADYRERYGGRQSDIASKIKGNKVVRPAELVYLGTTSLYRVGSSQYNRLILPAEITDSGGSLPWQHIGETRGYGTLHISRQTMLALEEAVEADYFNHVFGEGSSPKMRQLRYAINAIMAIGQTFISDVITQHAMNRPIYGAWLATNGKSYLLGEASEPQYHFDATIDSEQGTRRIINYWSERWLWRRLRYQPSLDKVRATSLAELLISRELPDQRDVPFQPISDEVTEMSHIKKGSPPNVGKWRDFAGHLYCSVNRVH